MNGHVLHLERFVENWIVSGGSVHFVCPVLMLEVGYSRMVFIIPEDSVGWRECYTAGNVCRLMGFVGHCGHT